MNLNKAKVLVVLVNQLEGLEQLADVLATAISELEEHFILPKHTKEDLMDCIAAKHDEIITKIEEF